MMKILIKQGAEIAAEDKFGTTALGYAALLKHDDTSLVIKLLLKSGCDLHAVDDRGKTPLHRASDSGNLESIKLFLKHGAEVNALDKNDITPLDHALKRGHTDIVSYLTKKRGAKRGSELTGPSSI